MEEIEYFESRNSTILLVLQGKRNNVINAQIRQHIRRHLKKKRKEEEIDQLIFSTH